MTERITGIFLPIVGEPHIIEMDKTWGAMTSAIGADMMERVAVSDSEALIVDESGRITGRPMNPIASRLYGCGVRHSEWIAGDAVLFSEAMNDEGEEDFVSLVDVEQVLVTLRVLYRALEESQ